MQYHQRTGKESFVCGVVLFVVWFVCDKLPRFQLVFVVAENEYEAGSVRVVRDGPAGEKREFTM